ncbi:MAG: lipoate--protein ligase family protein, partial [Candidatus Aenigmatarchaeota archaeon]
MRSSAERKVEDGKLLKAELSFDNEIKQVSLHGDFFIHPAEELGKIEEALRGVPVETDRELLERKMEHSLSERA